MSQPSTDLDLSGQINKQNGIFKFYLELNTGEFFGIITQFITQPSKYNVRIDDHN